MKKFILTCCTAALLVSCGSNKKEEEPKRPLVVCTTNILADLARNIGGDSIRVKSLMGPGVDPHLYKATQGDIQSLSQADMILYNGLHLEGKMTEILDNLKDKKKVVAGKLVNSRRLINSSDYQGAYDPHIWFDPFLWSEVATGLADSLKKHYPKSAEYFSYLERQYQNDLRSMHHNNDSLLTAIPDSQRVLITAHDAFAYFGRTYEIEVKGLQGISTTAEYGIKDVKRMVDFITENKIKAVFIENSIPPRSIEAVIEGCRKRDHNVKLGGELYSDALGKKGSEAGTYVGMFQHNVNTIAEALK